MYKIKKNSSPLYKIIYEELLSKIMSGEIPQNSLLPGENIIAKEKGVSRITVRSALNVLREKGLISSIPGLGHKVNEIDYSKEDKKPILFIGRRDNITPILFESIQKSAIAKGINCRIKSYANYFDTGTIDFDDDFISGIDHNEYSGIIFFSDKTPGKNFMTFLKKHNIATLFIGYPENGFDSILSDNATGVRTICDEFHIRGVKKLLYISDKYLEDNIDTFKLRSRTFSEYTAKLSLEFTQVNILHNNPQYAVNKNRVRQIVDLIRNGYDGVVASNALLADRLRSLLVAEGYIIPKDFSLATFISDDNYYREGGKLCRIGGVEEKWEDIGMTAFERFIARKKTPNKATAHILVSMSFIEGNTIKKQEKTI
ncbi:MAG TPA: GntR family transcriptional regulator [Victivallales bacterium]|nr:GntR family transcriptional regulator [Victivallales bacterium]